MYSVKCYCVCECWASQGGQPASKGGGGPNETLMHAEV